MHLGSAKLRQSSKDKSQKPHAVYNYVEFYKDYTLLPFGFEVRQLFTDCERDE